VDVQVHIQFLVAGFGACSGTGTDARIWSQPQQANNLPVWPASPGEALASSTSLKSCWPNVHGVFFNWPPLNFLSTGSHAI
jgi:hypothetical protein